LHQISDRERAPFLCGGGRRRHALPNFEKSKKLAKRLSIELAYMFCSSQRLYWRTKPAADFAEATYDSENWILGYIPRSTALENGSLQDWLNIKWIDPVTGRVKQLNRRWGEIQLPLNDVAVMAPWIYRKIKELHLHRPSPLWQAFGRSLRQEADWQSPSDDHLVFCSDSGWNSGNLPFSQLDVASQKTKWKWPVCIGAVKKPFSKFAIGTWSEISNRKRFAFDDSKIRGRKGSLRSGNSD